MSQEPLKPHWKQPSHPDLVRVEVKPGDFTSGAYALKTLAPGAVLSKITTATEVSKAAYSSVQTPNGHIELNSDLVYINHSCDPNLVFDMTKMEVRVGDSKPLKEGDLLTFFYPSSEWSMSQPFDCLCRSENCLGHIAGAKQLSERGVDLSKYWLNPHIEALLKENNGLNGHATNKINGTNGPVNGVNGHHAHPATNGNGTAYQVDGRIGTSSRELAGECGGGTQVQSQAVAAPAE